MNTWPYQPLWKQNYLSFQAFGRRSQRLVGSSSTAGQPECNLQRRVLGSKVLLLDGKIGLGQQNRSEWLQLPLLKPVFRKKLKKPEKQTFLKNDFVLITFFPLLVICSIGKEICVSNVILLLLLTITREDCATPPLPFLCVPVCPIKPILSLCKKVSKLAANEVNCKFGKPLNKSWTAFCAIPEYPLIRNKRKMLLPEFFKILQKSHQLCLSIHTSIHFHRFNHYTVLNHWTHGFLASGVPTS